MKTPDPAPVQWWTYPTGPLDDLSQDGVDHSTSKGTDYPRPSKTTGGKK